MVCPGRIPRTSAAVGQGHAVLTAQQERRRRGPEPGSPAGAGPVRESTAPSTRVSPNQRATITDAPPGSVAGAPAKGQLQPQAPGMRTGIGWDLRKPPQKAGVVPTQPSGIQPPHAPNCQPPGPLQGHHEQLL